MGLLNSLMNGIMDEASEKCRDRARDMSDAELQRCLDGATKRSNVAYEAIEREARRRGLI